MAPEILGGLMGSVSVSRVLILVKASPQPSATYGDTVCVAGVDLTAEQFGWLRLYPVPFRYLDGEQQFRKYDVVSVATRDAGNDRRPESRKIDATSIHVDTHIDGWPKRSEWVEPLVGPSMCSVIAGIRQDLNAQSLAAIRPAAVDGLDYELHGPWSEQQEARLRAHADQGDLFREASPMVLLPPRLIVRLSYRCEDSHCGGHRQRIIDWELTALQSRFRGRSETELRVAIEEKFLRVPFAANRRPLLFVGNQENPQRRAAFTILGLYYPAASDVGSRDRLF